METRTAAYVDPAALPATADNIVTRAADAAGRAARTRRSPATVVVDKAIPVAGGMAGGSADAAAALVALDRLWGLATPRADLMALAGRLGSDVPFAVLGGTGLGTGHGEVVAPVPDPGAWSWVVVPSREGMSTPAVYRHFDELLPDASPTPPSADALLAALATRDPHALAATLHNGLQEAAFDLRPDLRELVARGEARGCPAGPGVRVRPDLRLPVRVPGARRRRGGGLRAAGHETVLTANGPAAGATVVEED